MGHLSCSILSQCVARCCKSAGSIVLRYSSRGTSIPVSVFFINQLNSCGATQEWSAVVEMTAATEEYFLEIRRLQRLLAQQQQDYSTKIPVAMVSDREGRATGEAYVSNQRDPTHRRNSGVDDTVWIHRPETCDVSMSIPSPVDGLQDNQPFLSAEPTFTSGGGEVYNTVHKPSASAVQTNEIHAAYREDNGTLLHEWGAPAFRRRPASPNRKVSPPRRAQMVARAGGEMFVDVIHNKKPRGSRQTAQVTRRVLGRKQKGGSRSQVWIRAADARTSVRGADPQMSAVGVKSRPISAPRTKREIRTTTMMGDSRRADSLSAFDKGRQQVDSDDREEAVGSGGSDSASCVRQQPTPRLSSSSSRSHDHILPTVADPKEPRSRETGDGGKRRPKIRSHSASPRSSSSRNRTSAGDTLRAQGDGTMRTANASVTKHHIVDRKSFDGGEIYGEGGSDAGLPNADVAPHLSERVEGDLKSSPGDADGTSDYVYYDDAKCQLSSSIPWQAPLAAEAEAAAEHPTTTEAKECEEGTAETTKGPDGRKEHTADCGSTLDSPDSGDVENAIKPKKSRVTEGGEFPCNLAEPDAPSSWGSFEGVGKLPNDEIKEENTEEGSVRPVSSVTSTEVDAREHPNVDVITGEMSPTSTSNAKSDDEGEPQDTGAEHTGGLLSGASPRSGNHGSPNDGDSNRLSPLPGLGDDSTTAHSVSSHAVTEKHHQGGVGVAEMEMHKLLFDIEGDGDIAGDDSLCGENGAIPSEYGDDFDDDFEDEED